MKSTDSVRIGLTVRDVTQPFYVLLSKGAEEKATELGVELVVAHPTMPTVTEQILIVQDFVRQKVDAIIIAAVDSQGIIPAVEKANQAGIPVIAVDVEIWSGEIACTVRTDNIKGAELAAEYIAERLEHRGKVINIQGLKVVQQGIHRSEGLHNVLDRCSDLEIVFEREAGWTVEGGRQAMAEALSAHPDADALFAANDLMLLGALQIVKAAGKLGQMVMVGFDALPEVLVLIDKGEIDASVQQFPNRMGAIGVEMALKAIRGQEVTARVYTGTALISRDNVSEAAMESLQALAGLTQDLIRAWAEAERMTQQLRETQEQLIRQEKLAVLGQLAGGIGHELRNPLGAISNAVYFLDMVLEEPDPEVKETLEILQKEVRTSEVIISSLLDFARAKPPTRRKVDVNDVVQEALSRIVVPEDVELVSQLDETLPIMLADPDQLVQVFGNIILNAVQAMSEGGRLVVKSEVPTREWVAVSFADTGVGISEEGLGKLFEPLFTTKAKGVGLGLAVTKTLVEGHGGTIEVESEVGVGTTFTVQLPISVS